MTLNLVNRCDRCGKYWARDSRVPQTSCLVIHHGDSCCHYGWTEVRIEKVEVVA